MRLASSRAFGAVGVALVVTLATAVPAGAAKHAPPRRSDPGAVYLSLGDSVAFGFQNRILERQMIEDDDFDPNDFNKGYTDHLAKAFAKKHRGIETVNLACPGETTDSFVWECEYPFPLHTDYWGMSQLDAALATIEEADGGVGTITIALGANDLTNFLDECGDDAQCVRQGLPKLIERVRKNLHASVKQLRQAAPDAVIVLLQYYNPFAPFDPSTIRPFEALDSAIGKVAKKNRVGVANAYASFNETAPQPKRLCKLTLACSDFDVHPSNAGYREIADLMYAATGY